MGFQASSIHCKTSSGLVFEVSLLDQPICVQHRRASRLGEALRSFAGFKAVHGFRDFEGSSQPRERERERERHTHTHKFKHMLPFLSWRPATCASNSLRGMTYTFREAAQQVPCSLMRSYPTAELARKRKIVSVGTSWCSMPTSRLPREHGSVPTGAWF